MPTFQPPSPAAPALTQAGRPARKLSYHELKALNSRPYNPNAPALDCTVTDPDDPSAQEYARELRSITARTAHREKQIINGNAARAWFARKPDRTA